MGINGETFKEVLGDYIRHLNRTRCDILSKINIFKNLDRNKLYGILNHIYVRSPLHSTYVYKAGQVNKDIYVIVEGEVEITIDYELLDEEKTMGKSDKGLGYTNEFMKNHHKKKREFSLLKLNVGSYFGDEDGFHNEVKGYNVKITSNNCKLFLIPKEVKISIEKKINKIFFLHKKYFYTYYFFWLIT